MGYTHYYYQKPKLNRTDFFKVARDFKKMVPIMGHLGIKLGDGLGQNTPSITPESIWFNGLEKCGHQKMDIGLAWPSENAQGVNESYTRKELIEVSKGHWFAGRTLETRVCGGDCSYETFELTQQKESESMKYHTTEDGEYFFNCTKTNYKPYDLAVNVCLVIAKHYLKDDVLVMSDGTENNWVEAKGLCQHFLGYGEDFKLDEERPTRQPEKPKVETKSQDQTQIKIGSIFYSSWGYDQTNIDYYKVDSISKTGKTCKIVKIGYQRIEETGFMSERVAPDPDNEIKTKEYDEEKREFTQVEKVQAQIRKNTNGSIWLRCGSVGGGSLWIYESPMIATHYA